ncbi:hypothetical protein ABMA27_007476 [Loxostege sticticalis]|uniref:Uncharacterized protein n=1 Tax=Loxostege sticticalis TaxID=481309 RepID=A0ABR3HFJ7_LOXSC
MKAVRARAVDVAAQAQPHACASRHRSPALPNIPSPLASPSSHLHPGKRVIAGCAGSDDGRLAGEGRCSCRLPVHHHPPRGPFNAKVMRARVRLRAAMQERPAAGEPSVPHGRARNTPHRDFPQSTRPSGPLDNFPQRFRFGPSQIHNRWPADEAGRLFHRVTEFRRCTQHV